MPWFMCTEHAHMHGQENMNKGLQSHRIKWAFFLRCAKVISLRISRMFLSGRKEASGCHFGFMYIHDVYS